MEQSNETAPRRPQKHGAARFWLNVGRVLTERTVACRFRQRLVKDAFAIPFTRQQLADYLAVDRSAMTVELGKLAREGVLRFDKNQFELL